MSMRVVLEARVDLALDSSGRGRRSGVSAADWPNGRASFERDAYSRFPQSGEPAGPVCANERKLVRRGRDAPDDAQWCCRGSGGKHAWFAITGPGRDRRRAFANGEIAEEWPPDVG